MQRRRVKQTASLDERLAEQARQIRIKAEVSAAGQQRARRNDAQSSAGRHRVSHERMANLARVTATEIVMSGTRLS